MRYRLSAGVTVSAYTEVEADSLEDAIDIASSREVVLGGTQSGADESEEWVIDDADGIPMDIYLDKEFA